MTTTQLFDEVTTEFTGGNDLYIGTLSATTSSINCLLRVETVQSPDKDGVSLFFMTSPTALTGLTIAQLKALGSGVIQELAVCPRQEPGKCINKSGEVYVVDGNYFAAWLESSVVAKVKISGWVNEF